MKPFLTPISIYPGLGFGSMGMLARDPSAIISVLLLKCIHVISLHFFFFLNHSIKRPSLFGEFWPSGQRDLFDKKMMGKCNGLSDIVVGNY